MSRLSGRVTPEQPLLRSDDGSYTGTHYTASPMHGSRDQLLPPTFVVSVFDEAPAPSTSHRPRQHVYTNDDEEDTDITPTSKWLDRWDLLRPYLFSPVGRRQWCICLAFWACVTGPALFLFIWGFPRFIKYVIDPMTISIKENLSKASIAIICIVAIILLPLVFGSKEPFVWLPALVFNYWVAVVIVTIGTGLGMAAGYVIGRVWLKRSFSAFLLRYKMTRMLLMAVERTGPFKLVLLLRLSPAPYTLKNYLSAVPETITFLPYITASLIGQQPGIFMAVYFGKNIKGIADLLQGRHVPTLQLVFILVGLISGFLILTVGGWYCKRALDKMGMEAELEEAQREIRAVARSLEAFAGIQEAPTGLDSSLALTAQPGDGSPCAAGGRGDGSGSLAAGASPGGAATAALGAVSAADIGPPTSLGDSRHACGGVGHQPPHHLAPLASPFSTGAHAEGFGTLGQAAETARQRSSDLLRPSGSLRRSLDQTLGQTSITRFATSSGIEVGRLRSGGSSGSLREDAQPEPPPGLGWARAPARLSMCSPASPPASGPGPGAAAPGPRQGSWKEAGPPPIGQPDSARPRCADPGGADDLEPASDTRRSSSSTRLLATSTAGGTGLSALPARLARLHRSSSDHPNCSLTDSDVGSSGTVPQAQWLLAGELVPAAADDEGVQQQSPVTIGSGRLQQGGQQQKGLGAVAALTVMQDAGEGAAGHPAGGSPLPHACG